MDIIVFRIINKETNMLFHDMMVYIDEEYERPVWYSPTLSRTYLFDRRQINIKEVLLGQSKLWTTNLSDKDRQTLLALLTAEEL